MPNLPLELWDKNIILKLASMAGEPLYLDEWIESTIRMGFTRVYVLIDVDQIVCLGAQVRSKIKACGSSLSMGNYI